jgi:hypothetical protein
LIYGFGIFFFWPLYCLSFDLWFWYLSFGHCIVCPLIYGFGIFLLVIVLFKGQTIQWTKEKDTKAINQRTDNTMAKRKIYQSHKSESVNT